MRVRQSYSSSSRQLGRCVSPSLPHTHIHPHTRTHTHTVQESRESQLAKEKAEEELGELSDAVEMATLDKEMAEERVSPSAIQYTTHYSSYYRLRVFRLRMKLSKRK